MHNAVNMTATRDFLLKSFLGYYSLIALQKTPVGLKGGQKYFLNNIFFFFSLRRFSWICLFFSSRSCRGGVFLSSDISARDIKKWTEGKNLFRRSFFHWQFPEGPPAFSSTKALGEPGCVQIKLWMYVHIRDKQISSNLQFVQNNATSWENSI